jgi:hypothetical protein
MMERADGRCKVFRLAPDQQSAYLRAKLRVELDIGTAIDTIIFFLLRRSFPLLLPVSGFRVDLQPLSFVLGEDVQAGAVSTKQGGIDDGGTGFGGVG